MGFLEEEMDDTLVGTAMSNRQSQASQARAMRASFHAKKEADELLVQKPPSKTDDLLICEGVFHYAKALVDRLIILKYTTLRIKGPLFNIISHWVGHIRARIRTPGQRSKIFQPHLVLSMVCLSAVFVRSPLLPRDICRLVATRQLPFLTILKTAFPPDFHKTHVVRDAFTARRMPIVTQLIRTARDLSRKSSAWPPLRELFIASDGWQHRNETRPLWVPFPIGNFHITLLRVTRLLGLPDEFGARVLRWVELRNAAVRMYSYASQEVSFETDDRSKILLRDDVTDCSVIIDVVTTMRLCYSRVRKTPRNVKFKKEWEDCKNAMSQWLQHGCIEDLDTVSWTALSPMALSKLRGKNLRKYISLVDDALSEKGEQIPEVWGLFVREFEDIAMVGEGLEESDGDAEQGSSSEDNEIMEHVRTDKRCMYDASRCGDVPMFDAAEGKDAMDAECGYDFEAGAVQTRKTLLTGKKKMFRRSAQSKRRRNMRDSPSKPQQVGIEESANGNEQSDSDSTPQEMDTGGDAVSWAEGSRGTKRRLQWSSGDESNEGLARREHARKRDLLVEPCGIGLAWTIMVHFFQGSHVHLSGMDIDTDCWSYLQRTKKACDETLKVTIEYVEGLERRAAEAEK